jgi:hypothetical protein
MRGLGLNALAKQRIDFIGPLGACPKGIYLRVMIQSLWPALAGRLLKILESTPEHDR